MSEKDSPQQLDRYLVKNAPHALGNYSHAVGYHDLLFLCGMGPRDPITNQVPGLVLNSQGTPTDYDIEKETRMTLNNLKTVLEAAGSDLHHVIEMNVFLTNMDDFEIMNQVYAEFFTDAQPVRTTLGVASLPGKISVEMKAVALKTKHSVPQA